MNNLNDFYVAYNVDHDSKTFVITARSKSKNPHYKIKGSNVTCDDKTFSIIAMGMNREDARYEKQTLVFLLQRQGYTKLEVA